MSTVTILSEADAASRLDKVLARGLGLSLRRCRSLIEEGRVLVDGRPLPKGAMVLPGQSVAVSLPGETSPPAEGVSVVAREGGFAALSKPGGMHSVAGRESASLEERLPAMGLEGWVLLNRLDSLTSGLVLAAAGEAEARRYKEWQDEGLVRKWYLAVARGPVGEMELTGRILDDKRRVVRVTAEEDEPLRRTRVSAVCPVDGGTLVLVRILKGRRHQIRAHLAAAGHPLLGDPVYGAGEPGGLRLHHWRLEMPGFTAALLPDWPGVDPSLVEGIRSAFPEA